MANETIVCMARFDHVDFVCWERQRIKIRQRMEATYSLPNLDSLSSFATSSRENAEVSSTIKLERSFQEVNSGHVYSRLFHTQFWLRPCHNQKILSMDETRMKNQNRFCISSAAGLRMKNMGDISLQQTILNGSQPWTTIGDRVFGAQNFPAATRFSMFAEQRSRNR